MSGQTDFTVRKEDFHSLVIQGCPLGNDFNNSKCPVRDVRKLTAKKQADYFNNVSEEQIVNIFKYHEDCCSFFSFLILKPCADKFGGHPSPNN